MFHHSFGVEFVTLVDFCSQVNYHSCQGCLLVLVEQGEVHHYDSWDLLYCLFEGAADTWVICNRSHEVMNRWELQVESGQPQNVTFHHEHVFKLVKAITDVNELLCLKSVDFIVFRGHKQRCDAQQLEVGFCDELLWKNQGEVNNLNTHMNSLHVHLELVSHLQNPLHEDLSHV